MGVAKCCHGDYSVVMMQVLDAAPVHSKAELNGCHHNRLDTRQDSIDKTEVCWWCCSWWVGVFSGCGINVHCRVICQLHLGRAIEV